MKMQKEQLNSIFFFRKFPNFYVYQMYLGKAYNKSQFDGNELNETPNVNIFEPRTHFWDKMFER